MTAVTNERKEKSDQPSEEKYRRKKQQEKQNEDTSQNTELLVPDVAINSKLCGPSFDGVQCGTLDDGFVVHVISLVKVTQKFLSQKILVRTRDGNFHLVTGVHSNFFQTVEVSVGAKRLEGVIRANQVAARGVDFLRVNETC